MANSKPPLPPPAIAYLCDVKDEQTKDCGPAGTRSEKSPLRQPLVSACTVTLIFQNSSGPQVTPDQLLSAFAKMIPPGDTNEVRSITLFFFVIKT